MLLRDPQEKQESQILGMIRKGIETEAGKCQHTMAVCLYCMCWSPPLRKAELGLKKAQRGMERQREGVGHLSHKEYESWLGPIRYQVFWNKGKSIE